MTGAMPRRVLISGASIAGPATAYWLNRYGFEVTVVERSAVVRHGGYQIDIRGTAIDVVKRMGIYPELSAARVKARTMTFVDKSGKKVASLNTDDYVSQVNPDDIEMARGDLTSVLYAHTKDDVEYVFNDSIESLDMRADGVEVTFTRGAPRTFDVVIGADGIHSNTRRLVFGPEEQFSLHLGYAVAIFELPSKPAYDLPPTVYNVPGRVAGFGTQVPGGPAQAFLAFAQQDHGSVREADFEGQCAMIARAYADDGWKIPEILKALPSTEDLYFDNVGQIRMDEWTRGRVALVGDSCFAPAFLSGQGTSMALIGSYVLATELANERDHKTAFAEYERQCRDFMVKSQNLALHSRSTILPRTKKALRKRNRTLRLLPILKRLGLGGILGRATREASNAFILPELRSEPRQKVG
ncbi:FAD-dependent monooxygenase [Acrocarpospora sp. B8E8]|uniref:FAD-dependent monooxygenase n=1 Tax=Acrocarpospora sp. B8E8 TaxID=3153572 RepID=UPI00325E72CC